MLDKIPPPSRSGLKTFIIVGTLVSTLLWGSGFLINSITNLKLSHDLKFLDPLIRKSHHSEEGKKKVVGFEQTRDDEFKPKYRSVQWIPELDSFSDDKGTYVTKDDDIYVIKSIRDKSYEKTLYNGSHITYKEEEHKIDRFVASPNLQFALIQTDKTQHYRHSSYGHFWILEVESGNITPLHEQKISIAVWSPTSDHIAYVFENNVYIYDLSTKESVQASFDGDENIFNGIPDWVYEEEVLEGDTALWWSPKGEFVAFLRTNDSEVKEFPITYWAQDDDSYPQLKKIKYPKPGFENPSVQLALFNMKTKETKLVDYTHDVFTEVLWVGDEQLLLKSINREADFLKVLLIDPVDLTYKITRDEETDSWFEITHDTMFIPKSETREFDGYIDTISVEGYNHLAYYSPPDNPKPKILTEGEWEVVSAPSAFDRVKNLVYYISTEVSSVERHLYSVDLHTGDKKKYTEDGGWYSASFSTGSRFVSLTYRGPGLPYWKMLDLYTGETVELETNFALAEKLKDFELPQINYGEVEIDEIKMNYMERLPPYFDPKKKYPVLFFVYGGPGSQLVTKNYEFAFPEVVASQADAIVVTVDGRGTAYKGRQFRSLVRDKLGHYEVLDQVAAAKYWGVKEYVDENRIAMFGWSYGGYMTLKTLEYDAGETFKYGMSVAPVTDWRLYDSVYTERYMHTPQNNTDGYAESSVHNVKNIGKATRFLLCHGSGDDNVHFQHSAKLLDKFNQEEIENYDLHVFPDSDHAIKYHNANNIIYNNMLRWLQKAFAGDYDN